VCAENSDPAIMVMKAAKNRRHEQGGMDVGLEVAGHGPGR
jgi:hypothetical protein